MAWGDEISDEIAEEFAAYCEPPSPESVASRSVRQQIEYSIWAARELERFPAKLRKRLRKPREKRPRAPKVRKKQKPRVPPATKVPRRSVRRPVICGTPSCRRPVAEGMARCEYHVEYGRAYSQKRNLERGMREKLEDDREGVNHHFTIFANVEGKVEEIKGYVQTGMYPGGERLGEIFVKVGKAGDAYAWADQWAVSTSIALQYGAPVDDLFRKFVGARFEPSGATKNPDIPRCTSIVDYVSRWALQRFGKKDDAPVP